MKTSLTVLAALVAVAGLSVPAMAQSLSGASSSTDDFDSQLTLQSLRDRGVDATAVEEYGSKIKATITLADGSTSFAFFDPDTLRLIDGDTGGNSRVLSRLDVGNERAAPADDLNSLTWVDPDTQQY